MHTITIECDACGHQEHFTGLYTDTTHATQTLINEDDWQEVHYFWPAEITELYCPDCRIKPITTLDPDERKIADIHQDILYACKHEDIQVAYNLCDLLYDLFEREEEAHHAAAD